MAIPISIVRRFVNFLLLFGISAMSCPGAHAQNMGDADFDASAYNLNAQLLAVSKKGEDEYKRQVSRLTADRRPHCFSLGMTLKAPPSQSLPPG